MDGQLQQTANLAVRNFPRLAQVVVLRVYGLSPGQHTIKVVNRGAGYGIVDAFGVYDPQNSLE